MRDWIGKRYWLVGASEGLGRALAERLSRAGAELILSARNEDRLNELVATLPGKAHAVPADVGDRASVEAAAEQAGVIDGMVYLAGVYWPMKTQDWNPAQVEAMCDINFTGAARAVGAVIGPMVARGSGHIVLTGSLSGFRGLRGSGVEVQLVNPGFIRTRLTDKNDFSMPFIMEPEAAAREMYEHMTTDRFKTSFPWAFGSMFRVSQFLPDWAYYRIFGGAA